MKLFTVKLSELERELLEAHRKSFGLRSQAEAVRHLIVYVSPMAHRIRGPLDYVNPSVQTDAIDPYARWHDTQGRTPEQYYAERCEPLPEEYRAERQRSRNNAASVAVASGDLPKAERLLAENHAERAVFRGVTASGEPLPDRKPYQKTGKK